MHPLVEDLSKLTDDELAKRISKANNVMYSTSNLSVQRQAQLIYDQLLDEQTTRMNIKFKQHLEKSNIKLDEILDIK